MWGMGDDKMAIGALHSRLVEQCNSPGDMLIARFFWVFRHKSEEGNEQTEGLARSDSALGSPSVGAVCVPLATVNGGFAQSLIALSADEGYGGLRRALAYREPCHWTQYTLRFALPKLQRGGRNPHRH